MQTQNFLTQQCGSAQGLFNRSHITEAGQFLFSFLLSSVVYSVVIPFLFLLFPLRTFEYCLVTGTSIVLPRLDFDGCHFERDDQSIESKSTTQRKKYQQRNFQLVNTTVKHPMETPRIHCTETKMKQLVHATAEEDTRGHSAIMKDPPGGFPNVTLDSVRFQSHGRGTWVFAIP